MPMNTTKLLIACTPAKQQPIDIATFCEEFNLPYEGEIKYIQEHPLLSRHIHLVEPDKDLLELTPIGFALYVISMPPARIRLGMHKPLIEMQELIIPYLYDGLPPKLNYASSVLAVRLSNLRKEQEAVFKKANELEKELYGQYSSIIEEAMHKIEILEGKKH
jgi:hypothetical protein